ncbi:MAG: DUF3786 domain-containing protein [Thermodesulfobacteriota bacterium]
MDNYEKIVRQNLDRLYADLPADLADNLPAERQGDRFIFEAFGQTCRITPEQIVLGDGGQPSVMGIMISLYALHARPEECVVQPLKAFKEFPDSMPYVGAFSTHTEQVLVPYVEAVASAADRIKDALRGSEAPVDTAGDFAFMVYPLPKIALCYIFYEADEDFPASVTCLFSNNARRFLPVDALADVGEYASRRIIELVGGD